VKKPSKTAVKRAAALAGAAVAAVLLYALLFGPLFAFSPVKFGFDQMRLAHCTVFYPPGSQLDPGYAKLDALMAETEQFHRMRFNKPVRVFVCKTDRQYKRLSRGGGSACTGPTGTVVYIKPSIAGATYPPRIEHENGTLKLLPPANPARRDLESFLKHELSHAILYQNTSLWKAMKINRWVEEGLAIYFGNAHHYYSGAQLRALAIDDGFLFPFTDEDTDPVGMPDGIMHFFSYGVYGSFVQFLADTYGLDAVLDYVHEYIRAPKNEEALFKSRFGANLDDAVDEFRKRLISIR
jgi:hypothetical protein